MQITGKIVADASIKTLESGKQLVSFSIVDNETYTTKQKETKQIATFFNCAFWLNTNVAKVLKKGAVVELSGRVEARGYTTNTGDVAASLTFNTNRIKLLSYAKQKTAGTTEETTTKTKANENNDDLPF